MVWLFVLGLLAWCLALQIQLSGVRERLTLLNDAFARLSAPAQRRPVGEVAPGDVAPPVEAMLAANEPEPSPSEGSLVESTAALAIAEPRVAAPAPIIREPAPPRRSLSDWLSENGLAWIGGGALALGGLLLVAYAAEKGFFTPGFRIAAAVLIGALALAAGEALRRGIRPRIEPNLLVAGLTTAAGAAILYAAVWAAYQLYGFIPAPAAAVLLAGISLGLLALALLHGEPLGVLGVGFAYLVPVVSGVADWHGWSLSAYVALILATGMAAAGLRRWALAGAVTLAGAGLWALARLFANDWNGAAVLTGVAPCLALAAAYRVNRHPGPVSTFVPWPFAHLAPAAVIGSAVLATLLWGKQDPGSGPYAALATMILPAVIALGARARLVSPRLLIAPAVVTSLVAAAASAFGFADLHILWLTPAIAALATAGFDGALHSENRREAALIGAAGTALSLTLAVAALGRATPDWDWAVDAVFALGLAGGAFILARRSSDTAIDLAPAAWIAAAAEATGLALRAGLDDRLGPTAYGLLALVLAALAVRVKWRGFAETAAVACLASFAALLGSAIAGQAVSGLMAWWMVAAIAAGGVVAQLAAWVVLSRREDAAASREAISTLAVMTGLLGAFLALQAWAAPKLGAPAWLDSFTLASLRTLLILAAGLMLSIRGAATPLGRIRAPVLLAVGAVHGFILQAIWFHPWWGVGGPVAGPPLADSLMPGLLAPAVLLGEAARRGAREREPLARWALAGALIFLGFWMLSELRRLFQGPTLNVDGFGYAETAAYGAAMLTLALALEALRRRLSRAAAQTGVFVQATQIFSWAAILTALGLLAYVDSPWWGPLSGDLHAPALLGAIMAVACGLTAYHALAARRADRPILAHVALDAAGLELFALLTLVVRFAFHGGAMRVLLREASLETWTFSAVWAVYGLIVLAIGASRRDAPLRWLGLAILLGTTLKVFLFDMARLEGVVRAASFLALGVVLLIGALAARRFGGGARTPSAAVRD
jgi:uncharacterized membrane protein